MAIKGAFTFAEMVARLTRGYIKATGQQPDNLAKIKINLEAAERVKEQNKVINVDFNPNEKWWKARPTEEELLEAEYRRLKSLSPEEVKAEMRKKGFTPFEARPGETGGITGIGPQADTIKGIDKRIQGRVENIKKILTDEKKTLDEFKKLDKKPTPIKKFLTDDEATAQIEKLKGDLPFMERMDVLQLLDDIDAGKAYGAFDDVQRKELRDAISRIYTNKPDFASGGIVGPLHLYDGGRAKFKDGSWSKLKKKYKGSTLQAMLDNPQLMAAELGHEGIFNLLQMLGMKEGGRARFDKGKKVDLSKRRFIKGTGATLGVLSMLPFVGKFFKAAKLSKAAAPAAEVITKGTSGIPDYAYNLIEVVKAKGTKEIMEGVYKRNPPSVKYNYKGVEVVEDGMGNTSVKKEIEGFGVDEAGEGYEGISREVGFDINKGENIVKQGGKGDDAGKVIQTDDDYFEATVRPDSEGKMKDMEEFISVEDHLDLKKIADEAKDITIKKAEGGRIGYAKGTKKRGEGQYSPTKDKAWMQTMPTIDPRLRKLMEEHKKRKGLAEILGV